MIKKITKFFTKDLWRLDHNSMSKPKQFLIQQLRILVLAYRGFKEDNVLLRSSALTFYTLISIVPIIAMAFGIAKGFGFEEKLDKIITNYFKSQQQISDLLIEFSHSFLENSKGGLIAGIGLLLLFWSVMKVLGNIELSFNAVWGIKQPRTLIRKFTEYLSIMLIAPVLVIMASGVTVFISSAATHALSDDNQFYVLGSTIKILIELSPYFLMWILFTFIYMAIPNTKVKIKHAVIAGIIAGTGFNILEWIYFTFQIGAVQYNAIYGSFAALPLFLVWVQSSWIIVLFGCEIAFAGQHVNRYIYEKEVNEISIIHRRKIALFILLKINKAFNSGISAMTAIELCKKLKLPIRLVQGIINDLVQADILVDTSADGSEEKKYIPARELNHLKLSQVVELMETKGSNDIPVQDETEWKNIESTLEKLSGIVLSDTSNRTLVDLQAKD